MVLEKETKQAGRFGGNLCCIKRRENGTIFVEIQDEGQEDDGEIFYIYTHLSISTDGSVQGKETKKTFSVEGNSEEIDQLGNQEIEDLLFEVQKDFRPTQDEIIRSLYYSN